MIATVEALNFYSPIVENQLRSGRKSATIRLGRLLVGVTAFELGNAAATLLILRATDLLEPGHGHHRAVQLAIVLYAVLSTFRTQSELMVLLLGSICLSAGLASYVRLSPIAVCFIAAALLFNLPGDFKQQVREVLARLERPITPWSPR